MYKTISLSNILNIFKEYRIVFDEVNENYIIQKTSLLIEKDYDFISVEIGWKNIKVIKNKEEAFSFYDGLVEGTITEEFYKILYR